MRNAYAWVLLVGLGPLVGCVTENNVAESMSATSCRRDRECNPDSFEDRYDDDLSQCIDESEDSLLSYQNCAIEAGCLYDSDETDRCFDAVRSESCDDFNSGAHSEACNEIYQCTTGQLIDLGICLISG